MEWTENEYFMYICGIETVQTICYLLTVDRYIKRTDIYSKCKAVM